MIQANYGIVVEYRLTWPTLRPAQVWMMRTRMETGPRTTYRSLKAWWCGGTPWPRPPTPPSCLSVCPSSTTPYPGKSPLWKWSVLHYFIHLFLIQSNFCLFYNGLQDYKLFWTILVLVTHGFEHVAVVLYHSTLRFVCFRWQLCQLCRRDDNEAQLLLCDGCDQGYHTYCFKVSPHSYPPTTWTASVNSV